MVNETDIFTAENVAGILNCSSDVVMRLVDVAAIGSVHIGEAGIVRICGWQLNEYLTGGTFPL